MSADSSRRSIRRALRAGSLDLTDAVVVSGAAVLVGALCGFAALTAPRSAEEVASITGSAQSGTAGSTAEPAAPVVDLLVPARVDIEPFSTGIRNASRSTVHAVTGSGYTPSANDYVALTSSLDRAASVVVVVPSATDRSASTLALGARASETVAAIRKVAPKAEIVLVGPIVSVAEGAATRSALKSLANLLRIHYVDPAGGRLVGAQVDATGAATPAGLAAVGTALGADVQGLLAD